MTRLTLVAAAFVVATLPSVRPALAQHAHHAAPAPAPTPEQTAFLDATHAALARFARQEDAIAAGFRPLGPDMPHMGQHWVHPGRAVSGRFDASAPAMLMYLDVGGTAVLTGAAFTVPVAAGEAPPAFPFEGAWHAHAGRLMDEAFGLVPHGTRDDGRPRLAMLHAWTEAANPDGVWAADHWGLPFLRCGLAVPPYVPPDAGRAVALVAGYAPFYREAARRAADLTPDETAAIDDALARHGEAIERLLGTTPPGEPPATDALVEAWRSLWTDIERGVNAASAASLRPLFGADAPSGTHAIEAHGGH
jgi:hypothetical protein